MALHAPPVCLSGRKREDSFLRGMPFEYHRVSSHEEIRALIAEADLDTAHFDREINALTAEIRLLERQKRMTDHELASKAIEDLIQKYAFFEAEKVRRTGGAQPGHSLGHAGQVPWHG